jgi:hypothetical protein
MAIAKTKNKRVAFKCFIWKFNSLVNLKILFIEANRQGKRGDV